MHRSTTQRVAPTGLYILPILHDAWDGGIAVRILEHLGAKFFAGLRVAVDEGEAFRVVIIARLLAIRTTGFGVDDKCHC